MSNLENNLPNDELENGAQVQEAQEADEVKTVISETEEVSEAENAVEESPQPGNLFRSL